jgi:hypothetical protein
MRQIAARDFIAIGAAMTRVSGAVCAVLSVVCLGSAARAAVTEVDIGINPTYSQTGPTTVTSTGGFFSARAFLDSSSDFDGGTLTYTPPAASPTTVGSLTPVSGSQPYLVYQPGSYSTVADLNAAYPYGTYTFNLTNSSSSATATDSIDYTVNSDSNVPTLTASSYNTLQGLNASTGGVVEFNTDVPGAGANFAEIFLNVDNGSGSSVYSASGAYTATSFDIPGGVLSPGTSYTLDLNFDDRITGTDGNSTPTVIFFDTHTEVAFTTAGGVPEPAAWAFMLLGFGLTGAALRRRSAAAA